MIEDLQERAEAGKAKYGTYLEAFNGRDALWDAYQESLDLPMYLRQLIEERDTNLVLVGHGQDPRNDVPIDLGEVRDQLEADPEFHERVRRGLDDVRAGRIVPLDEVLARLGYTREELGFFGDQDEPSAPWWDESDPNDPPDRPFWPELDRFARESPAK